MGEAALDPGAVCGAAVAPRPAGWAPGELAAPGFTPRESVCTCSWVDAAEDVAWASVCLLGGRAGSPWVWRWLWRWLWLWLWARVPQPGLGACLGELWVPGTHPGRRVRGARPQDHRAPSVSQWVAEDVGVRVTAHAHARARTYTHTGRGGQLEIAPGPKEPAAGLSPLGRSTTGA